MKQALWAMALTLISAFACAQDILNRGMSLEVNRQRLDHALEILSNKGNFYFSYNGNIIRRDSLVTISAQNKPLRQILQTLLPDHYEFRESGNYIIIRKAPISLTMVTNKAVTEDKFYVVSGYVLDDATGAHIQNASIYEKEQLASTLTNSAGYFRLPLKQKRRRTGLSISKEFYQDTTVYIDAGYNQQITVTIVPVTSGAMTIITPADYFAPDQLKLRVQTDSNVTEYTYIRADSMKLEQTAIGRFLLSSRQRIQSINLRRFFTARAFQVSLTPGLSTHGKLSAQVINNVSLNILGGYTGGVNGFEVGGLFNLNKKHVRYAQVAGLFNITGGYMQGVQIAGITNTVLDSVYGLQIAGIANFAKKRVQGIQFAAFGNFANQEMDGVQIAGVFNYAKKVKGVQIGLINVANTSDGLGIGFINIVFKGYHKLAFSADEIVNINGAFKTGSHKLYNILQAGYNASDSQQVFTFGYGFGRELRLGKVFSINPEITAQHLYLGSWDYANILGKGRLNLNIKFGKFISIFGGPVYNVYHSRQDIAFPGYKFNIPPSSYKINDHGQNVKGWLGWNAGINFF